MDPDAISDPDDLTALAQLRRFRVVADAMAAAFAQIPEVTGVTLVGSVARPLKRDGRRSRRRHQRALHSCKDVDLAVRVTTLDVLDLLRTRHNPGRRPAVREDRPGRIAA